MTRCNKIMVIFIIALSSAALGAAASGCKNIDQKDFDIVQTVFDPANSDIPYPNDVIYEMNADWPDGELPKDTGKLALPLSAPGLTCDKIKPTDSQTDQMMCAINATYNGFSAWVPPYLSIETMGSVDVDPATVTKESVIMLGLSRDVFTGMAGMIAQGATMTQVKEKLGVDTSKPEEQQLLSLMLKLEPQLPKDIPYQPVYDPATKKLQIKMLAPLLEYKEYMIIILSGKDKDGNVVGIKDTKGQMVEPAAFFYMVRGSTPLCDVAKHKKLTALIDNDDDACDAEKLRQIYSGILPLLANGVSVGETVMLPPIPADNVAMLWTMRTGNDTDALLKLRAGILQAFAAGQLPPAATIESGKEKVAPSVIFSGKTDFDSIAVASKGTFTSLFFLKDKSSGSYTFKPSTDAANPFRLEYSAEQVPFVMIQPVLAGADKLEGVAIFAHGLGGSKDKIINMAKEYIQAKIAVVAIDAPWHGERANKDDPKYQFLSPNLFATRDNVRQAVLDWAQLTNSVQDLANGVGKLFAADLPIDASSSKPYIPIIGFVGESLGGIMGGVFAGVEDRIKTWAVSAVGAGWPNILTTTKDAGIKDPINAALQSMGIFEGTTYYTKFLGLTGWVLEQADPVMFVGHTVNKKLAFSDPVTLAPRSLLVQMMQDDPVISNVTTQYFVSVVTNGDVAKLATAADQAAENNVVKLYDPDNDKAPEINSALMWFSTFSKKSGDADGKHGFFTADSTADAYYQAVGASARSQAVKFMTTKGAALK